MSSDIEINLIDPEIPEHLTGKISFDKAPALELFKKAGLTQEQVDILWPAYLRAEVQGFDQIYQEHTQYVETVKQETAGQALERGRVSGKAEALSVMAPDQAAAEILKISNDMNHPYNSFKASMEEHEQAVAYVNRLYKIRNGQTDNTDGYLEEYRGGMNPEKEMGTGDVAGRKSSNLVMRGEFDSNQPNNDIPVNDGRDRHSASGKSISDIEPS